MQKNKELEEWFYPRALRLSKHLSVEGLEKEWKGRIPILVEDAWYHQQIKIDSLKAQLGMLRAERELAEGLVKLLNKYK